MKTNIKYNKHLENKTGGSVMKKFSKVVLSTALVLSSMVGVSSSVSAKEDITVKQIDGKSYAYKGSTINPNPDIDVVYSAKSKKLYGAKADYNETKNVTKEQAGVGTTSYTDLSKNLLSNSDAMNGVALCTLTLDLSKKEAKYVTDGLFKQTYAKSVKAKGNSAQKGVTDSFCQKQQKSDNTRFMALNKNLKINGYNYYMDYNAKISKGKKSVGTSTNPYKSNANNVLWLYQIKGSAKLYAYDSKKDRHTLKTFNTKPLALSTVPKSKNISVNYSNVKDDETDKVTISGYKKGSIVSIYNKNGTFQRNFTPKTDKMEFEFSNLVKPSIEYDNTDLAKIFSKGLFYVSFKEKGKTESPRIASNIYTSTKTDVAKLKAKAEVYEPISPSGLATQDMYDKGYINGIKLVHSNQNSIKLTLPKLENPTSKKGIKYTVYYNNKEIANYVTTGNEALLQAYANYKPYDMISVNLSSTQESFKGFEKISEIYGKYVFSNSVEKTKQSTRELANFTYSVQDNDLEATPKHYAFIKEDESTKDTLVINSLNILSFNQIK